jgi:hypothetical protein
MRDERTKKMAASAIKSQKAQCPKVTWNPSKGEQQAGGDIVALKLYHTMCDAFNSGNFGLVLILRQR